MAETIHPARSLRAQVMAALGRGRSWRGRQEVTGCFLSSFLRGELADVVFLLCRVYLQGLLVLFGFIMVLVGCLAAFLVV